MNFAGLEWILFDLDGTLWDHDRASSEAIRSVCEAYDLAPLQFLPLFRSANDQLWEDLTNGRIDFEMLRVRRFEMVLEGFERPFSREVAAEISRFYLDRYLERASFFPEAARVVRLASEMARLAILTNAPHVTQDVKLNFFQPEADLFETMITADEVSQLKPRPEFYRDAARHLGIERPESVLMIGDSWENDILVPQRLGWKTAWISHGRPTPEPSGNTVVLHDLGDLEAELKKALA